MEMTGEQRVPAPQADVWAALNDPDVLRQCIPGCETVTATAENQFEAAVTSRIGPIKARFTGKVRLSNIDPPNSYTISGEGQGGVAGFAKGGADVKLRPDGDGTLLSYAVNAQVGGKLAQIGSRLVDTAARKMADDFFSRFNEVVGGRDRGGEPPPHIAEEVEPTGDPDAAAPIAPTHVPVPELPAPRAGLPTWLWVSGLVVVVILAVLLLTRR